MISAMRRLQAWLLGFSRLGGGRVFSLQRRDSFAFKRANPYTLIDGCSQRDWEALGVKAWVCEYGAYLVFYPGPDVPGQIRPRGFLVGTRYAPAHLDGRPAPWPVALSSTEN
jgi:hypothetical protein